MVEHLNAQRTKSKSKLKGQTTNQSMICFFIPYSSKYKRKQTLFNAIKEIIFWTKLAVMQPILNMILGQLMWLTFVMNTHRLPSIAKLSVQSFK